MKSRLLTLGLFILSVALPALGQGNVVLCASEDGRRHTCATDTRGGVQLTRQHSGSPCVQGSTWGFDRQGIWVDRGCRAEFTVGNYNARGPMGGPMGSGQVISCSSDDGRRHLCPADTRGGVQMTHQHSESACTQGSTWGFDRQGIWVDRGCRAEFTVGNYNARGPMGGPIGGPMGGGQVISCSSDDGRRHLCPADTRGGVQMTHQHSESACTQGSTWGFDRQGIWVDHGCRAEFTLTNYSYHDFRTNRGRGGEITCSSDDERRHYCETGRYRSVRLQQQISGSPCIEGQTWGSDANGIWVDRGCRATFRVR